MKWLIACFVAVAAAFLILDQVSAQVGKKTKCYVCNSYFQQDCGDWFNNKTFNLEECDVGVTKCRKIVQEVYYNDQWNVRYIRQCAPNGEVGGDEGRECRERSGTYRVKLRYCTCDNQDGCNGAGTVSLQLTSFILPLIASLAFMFRKFHPLF